MSEFAVQIVSVKIEPHPNADAIEIARIGDYQSIVKKGLHVDGGLAVYVPEQAIVPEWLLKEMGMWDEARQKGGLAGGAGNRVKAIKLRGIVSQGIMIPFDGPNAPRQLKDWKLEQIFPSSQCEYVKTMGKFEGADVAEVLGITKYEPSLPSHMRGRIVGVDFDASTRRAQRNDARSCSRTHRPLVLIYPAC